MKTKSTRLRQKASDGRFELRNIPSGRYSLTVYRNGYVDSSYGQKKFSDPGAVLALSPGQTKTETQTTDQYGKFDLHGLAPGEYKFYSWDGAEDGAWEDANFLEPFEAQGVKIEVRDDEAKQANLTVIATRQTASN